MIQASWQLSQSLALWKEIRMGEIELSSSPSRAVVHGKDRAGSMGPQRVGPTRGLCGCGWMAEMGVGLQQEEPSESK